MVVGNGQCDIPCCCFCRCLLPRSMAMAMATATVIAICVRCNNQPDRGSQGKLCFVNLHFCSTWRTHHWYGRIAGLCGNWCTDSYSCLLSCFCQCDWLLHVGMEDIIVMVHLPWWTMVMKAFFGDRNQSVFFGFLENTSLAVRRRFPIPSDGIQVYFLAFWKTPD